MIAHFSLILYTTRGEFYYFNTIFHFRYPFFEWIPVLPDVYLKFVLTIGLISSFFLAIGWFYRKAAILLFFSFTYVFLIDVSYWNNHYYLFSLFNFFFIFSNSYSKYSIDSYYRNKKPIIYNWQLLIFKAQIALVYFFGAISKISNPEWLNFKSVRSIYSDNFENLGLNLNSVSLSYIITFITIFGILFDAVVPFLLFSKKNKIKGIGFALSIGFHVSNIFLLSIGLFPFAMLATLVLFINMETEYCKERTKELIPKKNIHFLKVALSLFLIIQLILPIRHFFIKGNVFWTGEGKLFAWHMMSGSTDLICEGFKIYEKDENGNLINVEPLDLNNFLNKKQLRTLGQLPMLAPQFFTFMKKEAEISGMQNVEIKGNIVIMRNKKEFRHIISPTMDLCNLKSNPFKHDNWILLYNDEFN